VLALLDVPPASALGLAVQASFALTGENYVTDVLSQSWYAADTPRKTYWRPPEQYRALLEEAWIQLIRCMADAAQASQLSQ
jgi:hypothetical protein